LRNGKRSDGQERDYRQFGDLHGLTSLP
jgi:hypothetical protein